MMVYEQGYIQHFGIKGQKWGIRRFQNEDGTLTDEGMRRYGISEKDNKLSISREIKRDYQQQKVDDTNLISQESIKKEKENGKQLSKRRQALISDYKQKGLTQDQAEVEAFKRERTEKLLKVVGGVALAAALTYSAYKGHQWLAKNADAKIKVGADIFRVTSKADENLNRAGYVVDNAKDAGKYVGVYGNQIRQNKLMARLQSEYLHQPFNADVADDNVYQITGKAAKNIRLAGDRNANKVYKQLLKNDKSFAEDNEIVKTRWGDENDSYANFNKRLVDHYDDSASRVQQKFYDALKKKGYGGLIDSNDRDSSGYRVKKPVILFNMQDSIANKNVRTISMDEVGRTYHKAINLINSEENKDLTIKKAMQKVRKYSGYSAAGSGAFLISVKANDRKNLKRGAYQQTIIKMYRKEHPGTKLSDAEILENELGS